jgi:hypothetical protein
MTFNVTGHRRSTSKRPVSYPHRAATQLNRLPVFTLDNFKVLKTFRSEVENSRAKSWF